MMECSNAKRKSKFVEGNMQIGITNFFTKSVCRTLLLKIEECSKSFDHNLNHAATKNTYRIFQILTTTLLEVPDPQRSIQQ